MKLKRKIKQIYRIILYFILALVLIFTSTELGEAQLDTNTNPQEQININSELTNSSSGKLESTSTVSSNPKNESKTSTTTSNASTPYITGISPKELRIDIPQPFFVSFPWERYKPNENDVVRVVVLGENLSQQEKLRLRIGNIATEPNLVTNGRNVFATFTGEQLYQLRRGTHSVNLEANNNAIPFYRSEFGETLEITVIRYPSPTTTSFVILVALLTTFLLLLIINELARPGQPSNTSKKLTRKGTLEKLNTVERIILDRETNTFSLARAQFVWWLTIIVFSFIFLFIGRRLVQGVWEFFPLSGFAFTFLISLGTLLGAQVASGIRGNKGSGEIHPSYSDLIGHGGVVALERVQQVVWNIIVGIAFVMILVGTYATASALPTIPNELLVLMGISSAGYLGGKAVRNPGPNINQVALCGDPIEISTKPCLTISGDHLSQGGNEKGTADAGVIVQMAYLDEKREEIKDTLVEVQKKNITTLNPDPDAPRLFCQGLRIDFEKLSEQTLPKNWLEDFLANYSNKALKITIINADGQRAVWDGSVGAPSLPEREVPSTNIKEIQN